MPANMRLFSMQASLGIISLIIQRGNSKGHINAISASGSAALDCTRLGSNGMPADPVVFGRLVGLFLNEMNYMLCFEYG